MQARTSWSWAAAIRRPPSVCNLAALAQANTETWVIWLARGSSSQPIKRLANDPLRERDRLAVRANTLATRGEGNVEFHPQTVVDAVETAGRGQGLSRHHAERRQDPDLGRGPADRQRGLHAGHAALPGTPGP